ncbi:hypothetical protein H8F22_11635 [Pseudomonas sp. P154a]|jgi:hypothetical protein|uniref:hypothetical protein n=1 Tax=Pseudomonas TaxID=286 RepID=UPI00189238E4|nr:hypothetical protein [Pseudomonas mucoides]MBF6039522.1 hypothetical protein [Pseudomonas mucoides]
MSNPRFPSEEQGGYDPIPTHPEPLSPNHITTHPDSEDDDPLREQEETADAPDPE